MNGPFHYSEAERRLTMAWEDDRTPEDMRHLVAEAQVHATLALAAATAAQLADPYIGDGVHINRWLHAIADVDAFGVPRVEIAGDEPATRCGAMTHRGRCLRVHLHDGEHHYPAAPTPVADWDDVPGVPQ